MKTKNYKNGTLRCKSYLKPAGNGVEVGFVFGAKPIFVGNFVKSTEASRWWSAMNREIRNFSARNRVARNFPRTAYGKALGSHLNAKYYQFLNRLIPLKGRVYVREVNRGIKTLKRINNRAVGTTRMPFLRAA